jgi:hypothetical protein
MAFSFFGFRFFDGSGSQGPVRKASGKNFIKSALTQQSFMPFLFSAIDIPNQIRNNPIILV